MDEQLAFRRLIEQKTFTLPSLIELLGCSPITARRRLRGWRAHTSINLNGRYYALPTVPVFDEWGLWHYQAAYFSVHGNLKQTAAWLVQHAPRGIDSRELGALVGLPERSSYLSRLRDLPGLCREWQAGKWVYLAPAEPVRAAQLASRGDWADPAAGQPTDAEAVAILVELLHQPELGPAELAARLARQGRTVAAAKIANLLARHGLLKKKRWPPDSPLP